MSKTQKIKDFFNKKRFKNWDEAFRALTPAMRQHSVRVADYTQVLFDGVCKSSVYLKDHDTPVYMDASYSEVAYKCGFYHQIGKAFAPDNYPAWDEDFSDEEKSRYCKYAVEGKELVVKLQGEVDSDNITVANQMIQEACELHMERWDGSGFPYGYEGKEISLIAQIVGIAKELDRLICERKSETPYEDAVDLLLAQEGAKFSPELMEVFKAYQTELRNIYKKYIQYTKTMPKTVPLVEKRPGRPMGLKYRQIVAGNELSKFIFEAVPEFGGIASIQEAEELLLRTGLLKEMTIYLLYEAADLLARLKNCEICTGGVLVPVFQEFYRGENQSERLEQMFEDTAIDRKKLMLTVSEQLLRKDRSVNTRLSEYIEQGITLVLDEYHPEDLPIALIREIGFTHVRVAKDSTIRDEVLQELRGHGITVIDWPSGETWLSEDELINYLMKNE